MGRKVIFRSFRNDRTDSRFRNNLHISSDNMTSWLITKFRILTLSRIRRASFNIKIRNYLDKIKYYDRFVIIVTNNRGFRIFEIRRNKYYCIVSKYESMESMPLLMKGILVKCLM